MAKQVYLLPNPCILHFTTIHATMSVPKALIMMADYGHDPTGMVGKHRQVFPFLYATDSSETETVVPYTAMSKAGFDISFATEHGKVPQCDKRMLEGVWQKLLVP